MDKKIFSEIKDNIGIVWLNRPEKKNALNDELWFGLPELVKELDENEEVIVIILAAKGDTFSAGIDINLLVEAFDLNEDLRTNAEERIEIIEITKKFQQLQLFRVLVLAVQRIWLHLVILGSQQKMQNFQLVKRN